MLQPVGPLPPAVYWRRRALTLAVLLAALALLTGVVLAVSASNAASSGSSTAATSSSPAAPSTAEAGPFAALETSVAVDPPASTTEAATTTDPAAATPTTAAPEPTAEAPPPAAPTDCPDTSIKVVASAGQPSYPVGGKPVVVLTVVNVGPVACIRDLDAAKQEILMYAGTTRIWSSNDCYPGSSTDMRTLQPQEMAQYTVAWSGLASSPGCGQPRAAVGPGTYSIVARLDGVQSEPAALVLT